MKLNWKNAYSIIRRNPRMLRHVSNPKIARLIGNIFELPGCSNIPKIKEGWRKMESAA